MMVHSIPNSPPPGAPPRLRFVRKKNRAKRKRLSLAKPRRGDIDPFVEGYEARMALAARSANPYRGPDARGLWDDGWMEAESDAAARCRAQLIAQAV